MGYADVSSSTAPDIKTPMPIDSIATTGVKLDQFYAQPVCSPTRASLMTGRYPMRYGLQAGVVRPWALYGVPLEERFLPQALKEAGYETAICGKWHLGHFAPEYLPMARGFDHQYGHYNGAIDYFSHMRDGGLDWHRDGKPLREEGYSTTLVGNEAVRLIHNRDKEKPLFLYVPFNAVHAPYEVPDSYKKPYGNLKPRRRTYAGLCAAMDESIGQILKAIDDEKIRDNTLIIFFSDNGGPLPGVVTSNLPLRNGKGSLYEGGVRVASAMSWKDHITPGTTVNAMMHVIDLYPTLITLAGGSLEQKLPLDGKDEWQTILGKCPSPHTQLLVNSTPRNGAIRVGDYKLVINGHIREIEGDGTDTPNTPATQKKIIPGQDSIELFDISKDISEVHDLSDEMPEKVKKLRAAYDAIAKEAVPPKQRRAAPDYKVPAVWGVWDAPR